MLSPEQLQTLGVDPTAADKVQESEFTLAIDLVEVMDNEDRILPGADSVEVLEAITHPLGDHDLSDQERALRTAYLAHAAGVLGLKLVKEEAPE